MTTERAKGPSPCDIPRVSRADLGEAIGAQCREVRPSDADGKNAAGDAVVEVDQPGLVGVKQAGAFALDGLEGASQALELGGHGFFFAERSSDGSGVLAGDQLVRIEQRVAPRSKTNSSSSFDADVVLGTEPVGELSAAHVERRVGKT